MAKYDTEGQRLGVPASHGRGSASEPAEVRRKTSASIDRGRERAARFRAALARFDRRLGTLGAVLLALSALAALELFLEARQYVRTGRFALAVLTAEPHRAVDPQTGLRLLRPSARLDIGGTSVITNSWGLRGAEVTTQGPPRGTHRIAVLGASSMFGMHAATNSETPPALLEEVLNATSTARYAVINAGVPNLTAADQVTLLERRLLTAGLSDVVWYVGQNDVSCRRDPDSGRKLIDLSWLLTYRLAEQNINVLIRDERDRANPARPGAAIDYKEVEAALRRGVRAAKAAGVRMALATLATLYDRSLPNHMNRTFSRTERDGKPCMDASALVDAKERLNRVIRRVAEEERLVLIDAARLSGRVANFGDSTHLSFAGSQAFATLVADELFPDEVP